MKFDGKMVGRRLRCLRLARGETQATAAAGIGVTQSALSNWERGRRDMSVESLFAATNYFGTSPREFFCPFCFGVDAQAARRQQARGANRDEICADAGAQPAPGTPDSSPHCPARTQCR